MSVKNAEGVEIPVRVVRANFNGADGGRDLDCAAASTSTSHEAACRLLLTRGLLGCSPDASCLGGKEVSYNHLPKIEEVCKAMFQSFFGAEGKGLVIVETHLNGKRSPAGWSAGDR